MCFFCCCNKLESPRMPLQVSSSRSYQYQDLSIQGQLSFFGNEPFYTSFQVTIFYTLLTIFGMALLSLSYYFLTWLTPWNWVGTSHLLWGATLYAFIFPIGFMFTITGIANIALIKAISPIKRAIIIGLFAIIVLFISVFALCPTIFDGYVYFYFPQTNNLYKSLESIEIFILWFPISLILFMICIRYILYNILMVNNSKYKLINSSTTTALNSTSKRNAILVLIFIIILLPLIFFSTTLLPNIWSRFDTETVYKWSTQSAPKKNKQWTIDWKINNYYLHLYFDTILFYGAIFITTLIAFILRQKYTKCMLRFTRKIIIFYKANPNNKCIGTFYLTGGNLILLFIWIPILCLLFYYWA
eukprot:292834_1